MTLGQMRLFLDGCIKVNTNEMLQDIDSTAIAIGLCFAGEKDKLKITKQLDKLRDG